MSDACPVAVLKLESCRNASGPFGRISSRRPEVGLVALRSIARVEVQRDVAQSGRIMCSERQVVQTVEEFLEILQMQRHLERVVAEDSDASRGWGCMNNFNGNSSVFPCSRFRCW